MVQLVTNEPEARLDLSDYGDMVATAKCAVGLFDRIKIDPADLLLLINEAARAQRAEDTLRGKVARMSGWLNEMAELAEDGSRLGELASSVRAANGQ